MSRNDDGGGDKSTSAPLTSWKDIAAYMGKGVRTVQRWERNLQFPLHRPGNRRHVVIAYPHEIDAWARQHSAATRTPEESLRSCFEQIEELVQEYPQLRGTAAEMCSELESELGSGPENESSSQAQEA